MPPEQDASTHLLVLLSVVYRSLESSVADIIINSVFGILSVVGPSFRLGKLSGRVH